MTDLHKFQIRKLDSLKALPFSEKDCPLCEKKMAWEEVLEDHWCAECGLTIDEKEKVVIWNGKEWSLQTWNNVMGGGFQNAIKRIKKMEAWK